MRAFDRLHSHLSPNAIVVLWLGVWFVCNLLQGALTELANDEAYYHIFAERLAWGYFDHPPMVALLIWAGEFLFSGEMGVRLFVVALQPLYLYILWRLIHPKEATREDATLYVVISAATLILQLYGFVATPDAPLMFSSVLFLLSFKWFCEKRTLSWLWMGVAMALMAYSKYHGALVVLFALAVNYRQLLRPKLYLSGFVTLILLLPHLWWQYEHDFASFAYHLSDRNSSFEVGNVVEFLLNMAVVFNPLFLPLYIKAFGAVRPTSELQRALKWLPVLFIGFFTLSSLRGYVQPQWVIVSAFGLNYLLFEYARHHRRTRRYVMVSGAVIIALVVVVRLVMIFNPLSLKSEVFNNEEKFSQIADVAQGRDVIFAGGYSGAAKYIFYTGHSAYCQPDVRYRTHQWQFRQDDRDFIGREVLIQTSDATMATDSIMLIDGGKFRYFIDPSYHPVREVEIVENHPDNSYKVGRNEAMVSLTLKNPYPYDIEVGSGDVELAMLLKQGRFRVEEIATDAQFVLPAKSTLHSQTISFTLPDSLAGEEFSMGFALVRKGYVNWFNSPTYKVTIAP